MTPLVLLVGFLGAGKTTFLRNLLPALTAQGLEPHVIINDYQNARVDAGLLSGLAEEILPISGSCVCCGSRDELLAALEAFEHRPGRVMILESNGTTDAEELIEMLSLEPDLNRFTLPIQVSIVDGKRWQKRFWHNGLERDQVRTANLLHVTRIDEISPARLAEVEASLLEHGIHGKQTNPERTAKEIAEVSQAVRHVETRTISSSCCGCDHEHGHHDSDEDSHEGHAHSHGHDHSHHAGDAHAAHHFASMQVGLPAFVDRKAMNQLLASLPAEVIRAKGLARLTDSPDEYHVFQYVDQGTAVQWLPIGRQTRITEPLILFIGPELPEAQLREAVRALGEGAVVS